MVFFGRAASSESITSRSNHSTHYIHPSSDGLGRRGGGRSDGNAALDSNALTDSGVNAAPGSGTATSPPKSRWKRMCNGCAYYVCFWNGLCRKCWNNSNNHNGGSCCYQPEQSRSGSLNRLHQFTKSMVWKSLYTFFSLFLLFGAPVEMLATDRAGVIVFEVLRNLMLVFFLVDMAVRFMTDKDYFVCNPSCGPASSSALNGGGGGGGGGARNTSYADTKDTATFLSCCDVGSFLFWCDLISTCAILYDLNYINPALNSTKTLNVGLDDEGIPTSGFGVYQSMIPSETDFNLLIVIARTGRCARFVQARAVVSTSNKVNWYWILNQLKWLNPFFYDRRCRTQNRQSTVPSLAATGESSVNFNGGEGAGGAAEEEKKNSRGVLQLGILAAVHAQAEAEAREAREGSSRSSFAGLWREIRKTVRSMRFVRNEKAFTVRHEAAMKIQRAWRNNHVRFENTGSNDGLLGDQSHSAATETPAPVTSSTHSNSENPSGKATRKRSVLASSSQLNSHAGGKLTKADIRNIGRRPGEGAPASRFQERVGRESQVGSDMRELTRQRVAIGSLFALVCTVLFTYTEPNSSWLTTMVVLHEQTMSAAYQSLALSAAVTTSVPELYGYQPVNGTYIELPYSGVNPDELRDRDILIITVGGASGSSTGWFDNRSDTTQAAWVDIVATFFIILFWFFGVTAFSGPVMLLVIIPIERMVRLLGMLMLDPLGYQSTARFKKFLLEEDDIIKNTRWTKEVLKGMETSFLMSTILRIGSLMKVGFGSAGVEIIQNNLEKGQSKNMLILSSQGSMVSCIFLFCDIRQFTDATEQLQEEVFVFTNRIAAVVHSICHSYGGAANKNVGDAFLLSWALEDQESGQSGGSSKARDDGAVLKAKSNQADKALLSVIKICISLNYDKFYLEPLSDTATTRLKTKLKNRSGPVVQMGFGLHAGKAVQGAIGSQRKIDATYVSEAVERAEFLESSTKNYGLKMLLSGSFYSLLHPNTRRRCRKIDVLFLVDEDEDNDEDDEELHGELMEIYTFDMDVDAIHRPPRTSLNKMGDNDTLSDGGSTSGDPTRLRSSKRIDRRAQGSSRHMIRNRRRSTSMRPNNGLGTTYGSEELVLGNTISNPTIDGNNGVGSPSVGQASVSSIPSVDDNNLNFQSPPELVLPTGPALYSHNVWQSPDMKRIRDKYVQGLFFQKFNAGLQAYYCRDWDTARLCFQTVLDNFDDGPSRYFISRIKRHNGVPPRDFREYTVC